MILSDGLPIIKCHKKKHFGKNPGRKNAGLLFKRMHTFVLFVCGNSVFTMFDLTFISPLNIYLHFILCIRDQHCLVKCPFCATRLQNYWLVPYLIADKVGLLEIHWNWTHHHKNLMESIKGSWSRYMYVIKDLCHLRSHRQLLSVISVVHICINLHGMDSELLWQHWPIN